MQAISTRTPTLANALKASTAAVGSGHRVVDHSKTVSLEAHGIAIPPLQAPLPPIYTLHQPPTNAIPGSVMTPRGMGYSLFLSGHLLSSRQGLKAVSGVVGIPSHVRFAHSTGVDPTTGVPDYSPYRRSSCADPTKKPDRDVQRAFTYMWGSVMLASSLTLGKWGATTLVSTWSATKDVLALASIEVNLNDIPAGKNVVLKWRGKPLFIKHRTPEDIERERATDITALRDPQADEDRVKDPRFLILLGVCTHLGCVPIAGQGDYNGYFCPCHGSHYDGSGRIRKGPAPLNLEVPPYEINGDILIVG